MGFWDRSFAMRPQSATYVLQILDAGAWGMVAPVKYFANRGVLKYFFENIGNRIYTVIDGNKRWTRKILNRLGFEEIGNFTTEIGQFDLFEKVQVK